MKPFIIPFLLAAGGLATGLAAGYFLSGNAPAQGIAATPAGSSSPVEARRRNAADARPADRDLSRLIRTIRQREALGDPAVLREIERMSTAELRAMVEELMGSIPGGFSEERLAISLLIEAASREWFRREGEEAIRQVDAMPAGDTRRWILHRLISAAARTEPVVARAWVDRLVEEFGRDWVHNIASEAATGAVSRGADDLLKVYELFPDGGVSLSVHRPYPEDFDFRKIVAVVSPGLDHSGAVAAWGARNPEAAWETTQELIARHGRLGAQYVGSIFQGISLVNDEAVAAGWLAEKIGEVPAEHRGDVFRSLWGLEGLQPERVNAVMGALTTRENKMEFAGMLVGEYYERGYGSMALKALASDADREQVLLESARHMAPDMEDEEGAAHYRRMSEYFERTMGDTDLPEAARERVRAALTNRGEAPKGP